MNKQGRKRLEKATETIQDMLAELEAILEEENEKFDNMPESLQGSDKASEWEDLIYTIESAHDEIENAVEELRELY